MVSVSIIVPVYNVEKYLARCLDYCINQTFADIEIICVNDGSTDRCGEILKHYEQLDSRIKVIYQENGGLSAARNTGVRHSKGKYILFVDSDDYISTIAVEKLFKNAEKNNSDVVFFDYVLDNAETKQRKILSVIELSGKNDGKTVFNKESLDGSFYAYFSVTAWSKLYKRDFLRTKGIAFLEGVFFEDVAYYSEVYTKAERMTYLAEPLYSYSFGRKSQIMAQNDERLFDVIKVYQYAGNILRNSGDYEKFRHAFESIMIRDFLMKLKFIKPELRERLYNEYKLLQIEVDYDFYETCANEMEKLCGRLYRQLMESKSCKEFFNIAGWGL